MEKIYQIKVDDIDESKFRTRFIFDDAKDIELEESIKESGIINPIVVKQEKRGYSLIAGFRRLKVAKKLNMANIPCIVKDIDDEKAYNESVIDNIHRETYHPIDEANVYNDLKSKRVIKNNVEIAKILKVSEARISQKLSLLALEPDVKRKIGITISETHGLQLLRLEEPKVQVKVASLIEKNDLSVNQLKNRIDKYLASKGKGEKGAETQLKEDIKKDTKKKSLKRKINENIEVIVKKDSFSLVINVDNKETIEKVLEKLDIKELKHIIKTIREKMI